MIQDLSIDDPPCPVPRPDQAAASPGADLGEAPVWGESLLSEGLRVVDVNLRLGCVRRREDANHVLPRIRGRGMGRREPGPGGDRPRAESRPCPVAHPAC